MRRAGVLRSGQPLPGGADNHTVCGSVVRDNPHMARTVLIVDDHPSFRTSARRILEDAGFDVVGEAQDGESGLAAARRLRPAVVLLDVQLPDLDGFEVALRLTADADPPAVVMTSSRDSSDFGPLVSGSGARGFVPKGELSGPALAALLP
jgi:DNA-binding NarL/FixJ family response regulator